jgi:hypothetical protein
VRRDRMAILVIGRAANTLILGLVMTIGKITAVSPPPSRHPDPRKPLEHGMKSEKDLAKDDKIFADVAYWKKLGEEYQTPLIVTGPVLFSPLQNNGFVMQNRKVYDSFGRRSGIPVRTYQERKGFVLRRASSSSTAARRRSSIRRRSTRRSSTTRGRACRRYPPTSS